MTRKTPEEMKRAHVAKTTRTLIRLKHSLAADEELNSVLPDTLEEFDAAMSSGTVKDIRGRIDDVLGA